MAEALGFEPRPSVLEADTLPIELYFYIQYPAGKDYL